MTQFNEYFYTNDFDQEMLDFLEENYNISDADWSVGGDSSYLAYSKLLNRFSTDENESFHVLCGYKRLTKQQFKDKIGMADKKENKERIFKLIDEKGYVDMNSHNKKFLSDEGILVEDEYYFKGVLYSGALLSLKGWVVVCSEEFQYFEEVESIPSPKEMCEEGDTNTFTKDMLVSGQHIVEWRNGERFLVAGEFLIGSTGYEPLNNFQNQLENNNCDGWDIVKVYCGESNNGRIWAARGFQSLICSPLLTLIWQRESPEESQKRKDKKVLEEQVKELKDKLSHTEKLLEEL